MPQAWVPTRENSKQTGLFGTFLQTADESVAELMAAMPFNLLCADAEHSPFDVAALRRVAAICDNQCKPLLVRVSEPEYSHCVDALDAGAAGVLAPRVGDANCAQVVVDACRYPPQGYRGVGPGRAAQYGQKVADYVNEARDCTLVGLQIETIRGLQNLDAILAVDGVDLIFVGPNDLSMSLTGALDSSASSVVEAIATILNRSRAAGRMTGIFAANVADAARYVDEGFDLVLLGSDLMFLTVGCTDAINEFQCLQGRS